MKSALKFAIGVETSTIGVETAPIGVETTTIGVEIGVESSYWRCNKIPMPKVGVEGPLGFAGELPISIVHMPNRFWVLPYVRIPSHWGGCARS